MQRYIERIDGASLRQRLLIFLALVLGLIFIANSSLLEPLRAKQRRLTAETTTRQKELSTIQSQVQRLAGAEGGDPDFANRKKQAALREELAALNGRITQEQRRFTPPERMRAVLEEMLERNKGLTLIDLRTLPVAPLAAQRGGASGNSGMYRHGIEITVAGSYADLYDYLRMLEKLPTQLYWAKADLAVGEHPSLTLKVTVHTVSFDRAWLIV